MNPLGNDIFSLSPFLTATQRLYKTDTILFFVFVLCPSFLCFSTNLDLLLQLINNQELSPEPNVKKEKLGSPFKPL